MANTEDNPVETPVATDNVETSMADDQAAADALAAELAKAQQEASDIRDQLMRSRADLDNLRKRHEKELQNAHKFALERMSQELLLVRDSLEMGLVAAAQDGANVNTIVEGAQLTLRQLGAAMEKFNIQQLNPEGQPFNPELHQAITMQEADVEPNTVLMVIQRGYTLNERLLRPAMVVVSRPPAGLGLSEKA